jgi:tRNA threonylcarbamoyladenosine modification (KEOPS) complex Cgi121 subunit
LVSFKLGNKYVYFHTVFLKETNDSTIINHFRNEFPDIFIQGLNFNIVYNYEHLYEVLKISTLAERRDTMCSNKIEIDFLSRMVGTNQISQAINEGGVKIDNYVVFVILAYKIQIEKIKQKFIVLFGNSEEEIFLDKKILSRKIEKYKIKFDNEFLEEKNIIKFLKEIGALITK